MCCAPFTNDRWPTPSWDTCPRVTLLNALQFQKRSLSATVAERIPCGSAGRPAWSLAGAHAFPSLEHWDPFHSVKGPRTFSDGGGYSASQTLVTVDCTVLMSSSILSSTLCMFAQVRRFCEVSATIACKSIWKLFCWRKPPHTDQVGGAGIVQPVDPRTCSKEAVC